MRRPFFSSWLRQDESEALGRILAKLEPTEPRMWTADDIADAAIRRIEWQEKRIEQMRTVLSLIHRHAGWGIADDCDDESGERFE